MRPALCLLLAPLVVAMVATPAAAASFGELQSWCAPIRRRPVAAVRGVPRRRPRTLGLDRPHGPSSAPPPACRPARTAGRSSTSSRSTRAATRRPAACPAPPASGWRSRAASRAGDARRHGGPGPVPRRRKARCAPHSRSSPRSRPCWSRRRRRPRASASSRPGAGRPPAVATSRCARRT